MPNWKKVIVSGSAGELSSLFAPSITGSLLGTASYATQALSASFATTSSFAISSSLSTRATQIDVLVKNQSGYNILKGAVVRITGSNNASDIPRIVTASYEDDNNSANTLGITTAAITNGSEGFVITEGVLTGVDTSNYVSGQLIYLGANGSITGSAPVAPLHAVRLGEVIREQTINGSIYVRVDNGYELGELHNVLDSGSSHGDLLVKSGSIWINSKNLTGSYDISGSLRVVGENGTNITTEGRLLYDPAVSRSVDWKNRYLFDSFETITVDWGGTVLNDQAGTQALHWGDRVIYDTSANLSGDFRSRYLTDGVGTQTLNWQDTRMYDSAGVSSIYWTDRQLYDSTANYIVLDWANAKAYDTSSGALSIDWQDRRLYNSSAVATVNWETGDIAGNAATATSATSATSASYAAAAKQLTVQRTGSNATYYPLLVDSSNTIADNETVSTPNFITFNPGTSGITATSFTGSLLGTASYASASNLLTVVKTGSNSAFFPLMVDGAYAVPANAKAYTLSTIYFNPDTGGITALSLTGSLLGTASTSSFTTTASFATTSSYALSSSFSVLSVSSSAVLTTGSETDATFFLTFVDSNNTSGARAEQLYTAANSATTRPITVNPSLGRISAQFSGSLIGSASFATTSSYALSSSFALATISSSFATTSSFSVTSSFARSASFTTTSSYALSSSYALAATTSSFATTSSYALSSSYSFSSSFALTASYVAGASSFPYTGSATISGSLQVSGSVRGGVTALTIASNTASMNVGANNFFTLTLVDGATTHLSASNIQPGQTINLRVTQGAVGTGQLTFNTAIDQPSGSAYSPSLFANAIDIITLVSFDNVNLYLSYVKRMI